LGQSSARTQPNWTEPSPTPERRIPLADRGSIEIVDTRMRRNAAQHFYRATQVPEYSKEDVEAMTMCEAQVTAGLIIQSLFTEVMASPSP
jgi:hypothetical protein